jgi:hypothetical protein
MPATAPLAHTCIRNKDAVASCTCSFALLHRPYPACSLHVVVTVRAPEMGPTAPWGISMYNLVFSVLGLVQSPSHHTSLPPSRNTRCRSSFFPHLLAHRCDLALIPIMEHPITGSTFEIIDAVSAQLGKEYGYYRIVIASSVIKYLGFLEPHPTAPDIRGEKLDFNTVPEGDWNVGYLDRMTHSAKFTMGATVKRAFQSVEKTWHPSTVDRLTLGEPELSDKELQCLGQMYSAVYRDHFGLDKVIVNHEWYPDYIYGSVHETEIYSLIEGHDIGPRFLAHVTENTDRVIGYMVERVPGRHATIDDLSACREGLSKLHALGIVHGSLRPTTFSINNGRALLHGFGGSYRTDDQNALNAEMAGLEDVLQQEWQWPTPLSQKLSDEITAIGFRDNGIHPAIIDQAVRKGKITITEADHKELLLELQRNGGLFKYGDQVARTSG